MKKFLKRLIHEEDGATMTEYLIILALIAAVGVGLFAALSGALENKVNNEILPEIRK